MSAILSYFQEEFAGWNLGSEIPFVLIAGPCVVEDERTPFQIAEELVRWTQHYQIPLIFKASYKKANRTHLNSFTGIGDEKALRILAKIREAYQIPVLTDVHSQEEARMSAAYVDVIQIPAFLCRQTELLLAAGKTGKIVNIKKGQFVSGRSMRFAAEKVASTGNTRILLTERGNFFGYNDLVVDFRNLLDMKEIGYPVVLDVTHSVQQPNLTVGYSGGQPRYIEILAKAGVAVGVDALFLETHPDPQNAKSDGPNMLPLHRLPYLLHVTIPIALLVNSLSAKS
jgi:2-dehydro-3-deoxyphosphooctonate aldolase (KDO 8-P synthase)